MANKKKGKHINLARTLPKPSSELKPKTTEKKKPPKKNK